MTASPRCMPVSLCPWPLSRTFDLRSCPDVSAKPASRPSPRSTFTQLPLRMSSIVTVAIASWSGAFSGAGSGAGETANQRRQQAERLQNRARRCGCLFGRLFASACPPSAPLAVATLVDASLSACGRLAHRLKSPAPDRRRRWRCGPVRQRSARSSLRQARRRRPAAVAGPAAAWRPRLQPSGLRPGPALPSRARRFPAPAWRGSRLRGPPGAAA
jgi:hypothetical protein